MELDFRLPTPFLFNSLKHHKGFINEFIVSSISNSHSKKNVLSQIIKIGHSMIDIYGGQLTTFQILEELKTQLMQRNAFDKNGYNEYIKRRKIQYQKVSISDSSSWTLLIGNDTARYIHIHPSRGSEFTPRVRALALKTAILLKIYYPEKLVQSDLIQVVNKVRTTILGESPIKDQRNLQGLLRILTFLQ